MKPVLSRTEMTQADQYTINTLKIPAATLMEHAALALAKAVSDRFGDLSFFSGAVVAGPGNNGGDVLAAARILKARGAKVRIFLVKGNATLSAETQRQLQAIEALGMRAETALPTTFSGDWILDGLFGIGLNRNVEGEFLAAIEWIGRQTSFVISADIPSGLDADTGNVWGAAVKAAATVTFGFLKRGLLTGQAADYVGHLTLDEIQIPRDIPGIQPAVFQVTRDDVAAWLPVRRPASHKGDFGHVLIVAGSSEMAGACALTALGALYTGAGLVSVAAEKSAFETLRGLLPAEVMLEEIGPGTFSGAKEKVLVIGPGLGQGEKAKSLLASALASPWKKVLDADALNLLALQKPDGLSAAAVATPHPKEAARLLGIDVWEVERNRYRAVLELSQKYKIPFLLKGHGTLIADAATLGSRIWVTAEGTSALAKGGSGDLLCGVVASLLAAAVSPARALAAGSWLHGRTAQFSEARGEDARSITPTQLAKTLSLVLRELA